MTIISSLRMCPSSRQRLAGFTGLAALLWLPLSGCGLAKIEPEEIDIAGNTETGGLTTDTGVDSEAGTDGNDAGGDGDGDPGDGDGDDTGDGDGDTPCDAFTVQEVFDGSNPIEVLDGPSLFDDTCGGPGPEAAYIYVALADGTVQITLSNPTFEGAVHLYDDVLCEEIDCEPAPQIIDLDVTTGQLVHILIDSFELNTGGTGSLEITPL